MWPNHRNSQHSHARIVDWTSVQWPQDFQKKGKAVCTVSSVQAGFSWGGTLVIWYWASVKPTAELKIFQGTSLLHCKENTCKRRSRKKETAYNISELSDWLRCQISLTVWESILMSTDWAFAFLPRISVLCLPKHISFLFQLSLFSILGLRLGQYVCHLRFWIVVLVSLYYILSFLP